MLKKIFIVMALFAVTLSSIAQKSQKQKVSGFVKTADGNAAEYITVALKNTVYAALTDGDGYFEFEAPIGDYTLQAYSISAHKKEYPVSIKNGIDNYLPDLTIIEDKNLLDEVIITGQFAPQSLRNSVYKVKVINNQTIQQKAATDIQSLLNTEIGIRISNDMSLGESNFELMGMSGNNVKVLVDGVPLLDRGATKQSLSQIDINNIEQVEIVEGPMSVIYGTDALAGVINIITKKAKVSAEKDSYSISARAQEESVGDEYHLIGGKGIHTQNLNAGWASKTGIYLSGGYTRNLNAGWKGDKTGREKTWPPKHQYYYEGTVGFKKKGFNAWYRLNYLDESIYNPSNALATNRNQISDKDFLTDRYTHSLQADWSVNNRLVLNLVSSYQDYKRKTKTVVTDLNNGDKWLSDDDGAQDVSKYKASFIRGTAAYVMSPQLSIQPGIEYNWDKGSGNRVTGEPTVSTLAAFLSAEWNPYEWLSLRPGVRTILHSDFDAPFAIPSIGTKISLNKKMDLRFSYARGFRAPTLQELYFNFHNASHNMDGNPNLEAERSNNFMGSFTWRILHNEEIRITSTLSGFYNSFKDQISTAQSVNDVTLTTYYNISKYKTTGGTLDNSLYWKNIQANVGFTLVGRYNSLSDNDSFKNQDLPKFRFSPELTVNLSYKIEKTNTNLNIFYKFTGKRKEYYYKTLEDKTMEVYLGGLDSYNTADFSVNQPLGKLLTLNAGVKNIFDVTTVDNTSGGSAHTSVSKNLIGCGRSYFVGLSFLINK